MIPTPIEERTAVLHAMLAGRVDGVGPDEARRGLEAARANREQGYGGRTLGFGVIQARPLYEGGDWQQFLVAVTDGERQAAITVSFSGSQIAALNARGEDVTAHLLDRLQGATGSLPNDGHRYENIILHHPIRL